MTTHKGLRLFGIYVSAALLLFWALAPIYWVIVSSISTRIELYARPHKVWFPTNPTFEHYQVLLSGGGTYRGEQTAGGADLLWSGLTNSFVTGRSATSPVSTSRAQTRSPKRMLSIGRSPPSAATGVPSAKQLPPTQKGLFLSLMPQKGGVTSPRPLSRLPALGSPSPSMSLASALKLLLRFTP